MSKKPDSAFGGAVPYVSDLDRQKLETAGDVRLTDEQYQELLNITNTYLAEDSLLEQMPTAKELYDYALKASKSFRESAKFFQNENNVQEAFTSEFFTALDLDVETASGQLYEWAEFADRLARQNKPTKGRAESTWPLQNAIRNWHKVWTEAGGRGRGAHYSGMFEAPAGAFLSFVCEILRQGEQADKRLSQHTILEQIKITLQQG